MKLQEAIELPTVPEVKQMRALIPLDDRSTVKAQIAAAVAGYLLSADLGPFWSRLSQIEIDAVAESLHTWGGGFDRTAFAAKYEALPESADD
jgi:hypothetical protein